MPVTPDIGAAETAIVEMTNVFRAQNKLAPVRQNPQLAAAARSYALKLTGSRELSHTLDGTTPADRVTRAGYSYCQVSENLASLLDTRGFTAQEYARRAVEGWENSPGHRANMLMPYVTETGVAVARAAPNEPRYIAVQLFGRPETAKYSFRVSNLTRSSIAYAFDGEENSVGVNEIVTHTTCVPGSIAFDTGKGPRATYTTRQGQTFLLRPAGAGAVNVELVQRSGE